MSQRRVGMLDLLRGSAMILVVLYHLLYDLVNIAQVNLPDWLTPGLPVMERVHIGFLWVLFAVSGICSGYSNQLLRRGVLLYLAGFAVTFVTMLWIPAFPIVFGVLSCFGACMVLTALCEKWLNRIPWPILAVLGVVLWLMFADFHRGVIHLGIKDVTVSLPNVGYLYPLGIKSSTFRSTDYFPIIPFFFMFLAGRGLYRPIAKGSFPKWFYSSHSRPVEWIGRHSLIIYAVHQPILIGIVSLIW
ncbi:MAG: DUF1624 domain-containing protein [Clostridia bacterium]|nr:DUF1624 domain-containing protein [Clostridia bacterium]